MVDLSPLIVLFLFFLIGFFVLKFIQRLIVNGVKEILNEKKKNQP